MTSGTLHASASSSSAGPGSRLAPWLPHLGLVAVALIILVAGMTRHTGTGEALAIAFDETAEPDERIWAMHLAANRATEVDPRLGVDLVNSFLRSDSEVLREAAHLIDLCRHAIQPPGAPEGAAPPLQDGYAFGPLPGNAWTPHRIRCFVLHRRKVGGSAVGGVRRMELPEVRWFLDSMAGKPSPSRAEVNRYLRMRERKAGALQSQRVAPDSDD